jgi:hypothetical protein
MYDTDCYTWKHMKNVSYWYVGFQSNRVLILFWLMLPRDHFVSRFLYFATADVKCCLIAVTICSVFHFSDVIFIWSFRIIDTSNIKCWELSKRNKYDQGPYTFIINVKLLAEVTSITMFFWHLQHRCLRKT